MKERHNTYYDSITPESSDAEFLKGVLRKAENMDTINKKRTSKRPVLIACAAALTLCVGVTAAGAAGLIDFAELFGGRLAVADNERASVLLAEVSGQHFEISSDDYNVELKGVVGDDTAVIGRIEITRKDGKPVSDDFINAPSTEMTTDWFYGLNKTQLIPSEYYVNALGSYSSSSMRTLSIIVNESGNLDIYFDVHRIGGGVDGEKFVIMLKNLYTVDESGVKKPVFPEEIWVDFNYLPSEVALAEKTLLLSDAAFGDVIFISSDTDVAVNAPEDMQSGEVRCTFSSISANISSESRGMLYSLYSTDINSDIELIGADGSVIARTGYKVIGGNAETDYYELYYYNEDGVRTAVNIEDVVKVRINGTDYDL